MGFVSLGVALFLFSSKLNGSCSVMFLLPLVSLCWVFLLYRVFVWVLLLVLKVFFNFCSVYGLLQALSLSLSLYIYIYIFGWFGIVRIQNSQLTTALAHVKIMGSPPTTTWSCQ